MYNYIHFDPRLLASSQNTGDSIACLSGVHFLTNVTTNDVATLQALNGYIREFRIWKVSRSPGDIKASYKLALRDYPNKDYPGLFSVIPLTSKSESDLKGTYVETFGATIQKGSFPVNEGNVPWQVCCKNSQACDEEVRGGVCTDVVDNFSCPAPTTTATTTTTTATTTTNTILASARAASFSDVSSFGGVMFEVWFNGHRTAILLGGFVFGGYHPYYNWLLGVFCSDLFASDNY
jgi:hypothetical protein